MMNYGSISIINVTLRMRIEELERELANVVDERNQERSWREELLSKTIPNFEMRVRERDKRIVELERERDELRPDAERHRQIKEIRARVGAGVGEPCCCEFNEDGETFAQGPCEAHVAWAEERYAPHIAELGRERDVARKLARQYRDHAVGHDSGILLPWEKPDKAQEEEIKRLRDELQEISAQRVDAEYRSADHLSRAQAAEQRIEELERAFAVVGAAGFRDMERVEELKAERDVARRLCGRMRFALGRATGWGTGDSYSLVTEPLPWEEGE